jgi:PEP-CTERM motif
MKLWMNACPSQYPLANTQSSTYNHLLKKKTVFSPESLFTLGRGTCTLHQRTVRPHFGVRLAGGERVVGRPNSETGPILVGRTGMRFISPIIYWRALSIALLGLVVIGASSQSRAQPFNEPPPAGAILDLNGQPITNDQQSYSVDFVASLADTAITFAFRQDPSYLSFSNVSLVDLTNPSGNLLLNGDFALGTLGTSDVTDWTYANVYGAEASGVLESGCGVGGSNCWYDGAVQAYDAISQTVATNIGDTYEISFNLNGGGSQDGVYSRLSTNGDITDPGGNGIDVLAYAQAGLPPPGIPEPSTWAMMLIGFVGFGFVGGYRRARPAV